VQIVTACSQPGRVAISYDDGPCACAQCPDASGTQRKHIDQYSSGIQDVFESNGAYASFFINENNYGCIYTRVDGTTALPMLW
jgi:hypothetical protein